MMGHADKPDYEKLIKILEKGKSKIPPYLYMNQKSSVLVDAEVIYRDLLLIYSSYFIATQYSSGSPNAYCFSYKAIHKISSNQLNLNYKNHRST
jgi:hypothetical protein